MKNNETIKRTHIFKTIFAELGKEMQEPQHTKPGTPQDNFIHGLDVHHTKDKNKLVKYKIPKLVLDMLLLWDTQLPKHQALDEGTEQDEHTVSHIYQGLLKVCYKWVLDSHCKMLFFILQVTNKIFT